MNITETQISKTILDIIKRETDLFKNDVSITDRNTIPNTSDIPITKPTAWFRIKDVSCVYVDMIGSTKLSVQRRQKTMAKIYRLFTETIIRIFHEFDSPYIDVKGDGVFALFNYNQVYRALAAAVTIKTFVEKEFIPRVENIGQDDEKNIGAHIGIDRNTLLVRKFGLKKNDDRDDRQNEVWAGKTVNMAAKLASRSESGELLVSDRFYSQITDNLVRKSCPCSGTSELWKKIDINDEKFDFSTIYKLESIWCQEHGVEYCEKILKLDK